MGFFNSLLVISDGLLDLLSELSGVLYDLLVDSCLVVDTSGVVLLQMGDVVLVEFFKVFLVCWETFHQSLLDLESGFFKSSFHFTDDDIEIFGFLFETEWGFLGEVDEDFLVEGGLDPAVVEGNGQAVVGGSWKNVEAVSAPIFV